MPGARCFPGPGPGCGGTSIGPGLPWTEALGRVQGADTERLSIRGPRGRGRGPGLALHLCSPTARAPNVLLLTLHPRHWLDWETEPMKALMQGFLRIEGRPGLGLP